MYLREILLKQGTAKCKAEQIKSLVRFQFRFVLLDSRGGCRYVVCYSYRRASTGSSFDARMAGTRPLITPTISNTAVERMTVMMEIRR